MDLVVVTRAADAHLLRYFLASYECFWEGGGNLVLVTSRSDSYLWRDISLPPNTRLIYREDFPELAADDFQNQLYLKLVAYRFVETEYFVVMDSDFLLVAPCGEDAFFQDGKPVWFRREWDENTGRWRKGSELFAGASIDHLYMSAPVYVLSRKVAAALDERFDLRRIFSTPGVSEFVVYGWFARQFFPDVYAWVDLEPDDITPREATALRPAGRNVNQIPPTYCRLDPAVSLDSFPGASYVTFWSHWDLAEAKMAEFLQEAHRRHPGRTLTLPPARRIYPLIHLPAPVETIYSRIRGLYSDGWVKDEVWFSVEGGNVGWLRMEFDVPAGPLTGYWSVGGEPERSFQFGAGGNSLPIELDQEDSPRPVLLRFDQPDIGGHDSTNRTLRARLTGMSLDSWKVGLSAFREAQDRELRNRDERIAILEAEARKKDEALSQLGSEAQRLASENHRLRERIQELERDGWVAHLQRRLRRGLSGT